MNGLALPSKVTVGLIGASHYHTFLYTGPLVRMPDVEIVGVSDPNAQVAERIAAELGCTSFVDFVDLCDKARPDFIFALGRHCDMAAEIAFLISRRIPFMAEKPCGLNGDTVRGLADQARKAGCFAAVPFTWRRSPLARAVAEHASTDRLLYLSAKYVAGGPSRYEKAGCAWMLDPEQSGGGSTIVLSIHLFDLFRQLVGRGQVEVVSSELGNSRWRLPIEDRSTVTLAAGDAICAVETGYTFESSTGVADLAWSAVTAHRYLRTNDWRSLEIREAGADPQKFRFPSVQQPYYDDFVLAMIEAFREGRAPEADLDDCAHAMALVDQAYAIARPLDIDRTSAAVS